MTKPQLELAQFLLSVFVDAQRHAEILDPGRLRLDTITQRLDGIAGRAADAFIILADRHPATVRMQELNTENAAAWTTSVPR